MNILRLLGLAKRSALDNQTKSHIYWFNEYAALWGVSTVKEKALNDANYKAALLYGELHKKHVLLSEAYEDLKRDRDRLKRKLKAT
jgi:hypothetical protein